MFYLIMILLSQLVLAQNYESQMKGSFVADLKRKEIVSYTLQWTEENGVIAGRYTDDTYVKSATVSGEGGSEGTVFVIKLPVLSKGTKSIVILSPVLTPKEASKDIEVNVITRGPNGNTLQISKGQSRFVALSHVAQRQEEECSEGFGMLAGFCGVYAGVLQEDEDKRNKCNLLFADVVRFELKEDGSVVLHLGEVNELISSPAHIIGRIPVNSGKSSIDLVSRICGPLSGVNSSSITCKRTHLMGDFTTRAGVKYFTGTYTITEEGTNISCRYSLSMGRETIE